MRVSAPASLSPLSTRSIRFAPEKVVVDTDGNVYVVDPLPFYQGIVQYNKDAGVFIGLFRPQRGGGLDHRRIVDAAVKRWFSGPAGGCHAEKPSPPPTATYIRRREFSAACPGTQRRQAALHRLTPWVSTLFSRKARLTGWVNSGI
ncbi:MAG: hypothetical protein ACLU9S_01880 [Oscillospiraceae bacterium]